MEELNILTSKILWGVNLLGASQKLGEHSKDHGKWENQLGLDSRFTSDAKRKVVSQCVEVNGAINYEFCLILIVTASGSKLFLMIHHFVYSIRFVSVFFNELINCFWKILCFNDELMAKFSFKPMKLSRSP